MDAPTTTAKRKRAATDTAAAVDDVSDAEVEEFYAILRRMREASRRLCSGAGAGAVRAPTRAPAWCPSFSWEDFAPPQPTPAPAPAPAPQLPDESVAENATPPLTGGLDLNAEPEPEAPTVAAAAPATPRSERVPA